MKIYRTLRMFINDLFRSILTPPSLITAPLTILIILHSTNIHKSYGMSTVRKLKLGVKMLLNTRRIPTSSSYRAHLAMALKILETPPSVPGDIIECGTWKGGSAANLSLVCKIVGRKLKVYDSFEGLPEPKSGERIARVSTKGAYRGTLEEVKVNIKRHGAIECCEFVKGLFEDTLPKLNLPLLLAYLDVDFEASLHTCVKYIWPNLVDEGYLFTDESVLLDYVALFYSEKWWSKYFNRTPPGLIGAGTGLPLGQFYIGPFPASGWYSRQFQNSASVSYTQKNMSGYWSYYPDDCI
jgi:O-methyltransferase